MGRRFRKVITLSMKGHESFILLLLLFGIVYKIFATSQILLIFIFCFVSIKAVIDTESANYEENAIL